MKSSPENPTPSRRGPTLRARSHAVVVLPTLNEELGLDRTLGELPFDRFADPNYPVQAIVIDGGSTDRTLEVARKWGVPVLRQTTRGKGAAVLEAIRWVRDQGVPHVVILDADATYPPRSILPALSLLREGADLVVGIRQPVGGPPRNARGMVHRVGNVALSFAASLLSRRTILDICSGFWAVSTERFEELGIGAAAFAIEAELVLKALRANLEVVQIPIEYRERLGEAKIRALRDGGAILLSIFEYGRRASAAQSVRGIPGIPARELLQIGLITGARTAVLECPPSGVQLANRLGLLLHRALPKVEVEVRPGSGKTVISSDTLSEPNKSWLLIALPSPGAPGGARSLTVAVCPSTKELAVLMPADPASSNPSPSARPIPGLPSLERLVRSQLWGLGAVSTRVGFDPGQQQRTMLRANGFRTQTVSGLDVAPITGRP